jgi:signal peptidase I
MWSPSGGNPTAPRTPETAVLDPSPSEANGPRSSVSTGSIGSRSKPAAKGRRLSRRGRWVLEWAAVLVVAIGVAVAIRTFVVQTFYIPSQSMEPTLMVGDRILVDKLSYHLHSVHRGDIVVFGNPPLEAGSGVKDLVKRVIGLPGDVISSAGGHVVIDGKQLSEPWLSRGVVTTEITPQTIKPDHYFVMGDNRTDSQDSRYFGPIPRSLIVGHVVMRIWPLSSVRFF